MNILKSSLIVSCQAPSDSPLHQPEMIGAIALTSIMNGAKGVRIDSPSHIRAVRKLAPDIPIIGLWKQMGLNSSVYITPRYEDAVAVSEAGADIIAVDATLRPRPNGEQMPDIIARIKSNLDRLVMADIDTIESAIASSQAGADFIGTTLYGYTEDTNDKTPPNFDFLQELVTTIDKPIICEGGIKTPQQAKKALEIGAFAVVVGTAITGIDLQTREYVATING
ncbi:N-acetylmannosamine-6-phosphate 2-epimerase [Cyanobacterium stanieri LEGE 03274]|uniref:Putative N-acetylmannosamine-6-phosphate 2-epimerase n=1 Tax=Cyanobacterium stanieri LEGE 03274 TaxID=1828756 RepID=A0ABR9UZW9_9CHRO|nr:N-acetylmannosamine-6-phosphate 2-epimerase [Cyanobacterium stanieri]MBE9221152.1 N-acetylmannosamine-6-phosphate 2-epimerase [Cyanobacterium stanieri LEGE 03274]